jgi:Serine dehydrogenase proteinase
VPSWNELLNEFGALPNDAAKLVWLDQAPVAQLQKVSELRGGRNVIAYASAFLQKPTLPGLVLQLTHEELNGLMSVMYGMDWSKGLTLLLHTPGGVTNAAETIVAYLRSKFHDVEVIVPTFAMSAGTMIALAADRIIMGRQSQLGPIDPQIPLGGRTVSARAIVDQFDLARQEILADRRAAHLWAPVLQHAGPSLLQESLNALEYGESMVARWLETSMFKGRPNAAELAKSAAGHFNDASTHKSHGRRIDRAEARQRGIVVEDLESDQGLQEAVLTAYHAITILFEQTRAAKALITHANKRWVKNAG